MKGWAGIAIALSLVACGGSSTSQVGGDGGTTGSSSGSGSGSGSDGGSSGSSSSSGSGSGSGSSSGSTDGGGGTTITGSVGGMSFNNAATALWIGSPDSATTTVVYVFSSPVHCNDLASAGWDTRIPNKTQVLEMKMFGTRPQTYKAVTTATPGPGEAAVNYTLSSTSGTPTETAGSAGTVTLAALNGMTDAVGSFALQFGSEMLSGTYDAAYCPGGHEP